MAPCVVVNAETAANAKGAAMTYEPQPNGRVLVYQGSQRLGVISWNGEEWAYRSTVAHWRDYRYTALQLNSIQQKLLSLPEAGPPSQPSAPEAAAPAAPAAPAIASEGGSSVE